MGQGFEVLNLDEWMVYCTIYSGQQKAAKNFLYYETPPNQVKVRSNIRSQLLLMTQVEICYHVKRAKKCIFLLRESESGLEWRRTIMVNFIQIIRLYAKIKHSELCCEMNPLGNTGQAVTFLTAYSGEPTNTERSLKKTCFKAHAMVQLSAGQWPEVFTQDNTAVAFGQVSDSHWVAQPKLRFLPILSSLGGWKKKTFCMNTGVKSLSGNDQ